MTDRPLNAMTLAVFCARFPAPAGFGVAMFEPKAFAGLGSIAGAAATAALARIEAAVHAAAADMAVHADLWARIDRLTGAFADALHAANPAVGLHEPAVEFAIAGFRDALTTYAYATTGRSPRPSFQPVYAAWVHQSRRIAGTIHNVAVHAAAGPVVWRVQVVNDVYGRAGLRVILPAEDGTEQTIEIEDRAYACPAALWMERVLITAAAALFPTS